MSSDVVGGFGPGTIPYQLNQPFYSDGAAKERAVALPDGTTAHIEADGDITLPVGTVFVKQFRIDSELIETRLLVRHDDGEWAGYSYEWGVDGVNNDAVLVDAGGKSKVLPNGQTWSYPTRAGCMACHTAAAGRVLGWEVGQLNGPQVYASTGRLANQLFTLSSIGIFDAPVGDVADLPRYAPLNLSTVDVAVRGATYLHTNCSMCHRPGGGGQSDADLRLSTGLANANICDQAPSEGSFGVANARVFAPGDPARSMISVRMKRLAAGRMPLFGSNIVDAVGTDVVDRWITSTAACPAPTP
jgi:uncharacterized repeat protein (TIGR03806 family)